MWNNQGGESTATDQGGGYLNSPGFGSQQQSQERRNRQRTQNIMPCTVAQVMQAVHNQDKFEIDNIELHQVTLVGLVRSVKETPTRMDYEFDDMTGPPLEVKQFVDNDENSEEERTIPMRENTYVRIFGHIRVFANKRSVVAFRVLPILDMNELTSHLLEVIHSHLTLTKAQQGTSGAGNTAAPGGGTDMSMDTAGGYTGAQPDLLKTLTPVQAQVQSVFNSCRDEKGFSVQHICEQLRGVPQKPIKDAIDFLSSEGHIYSTIDDDHYKSTDTNE